MLTKIKDNMTIHCKESICGAGDKMWKKDSMLLVKRLDVGIKLNQSCQE